MEDQLLEQASLIQGELSRGDMTSLLEDVFDKDFCERGAKSRDSFESERGGNFLPQRDQESNS